LMGNEIQNKLNELKLKGWTLASIAREIGQSSRAVESWNQGVRNPANLQPSGTLTKTMPLSSPTSRMRAPVTLTCTNSW
jgi:hypothetical protein